MPDNIRTFPVACGGGLVNNLDPITHSRSLPGSASRMINYEPALLGGYRRISGFTNDYGTLPGTGGVLGISVFSNLNDGIFGCRAPSTGNNYFHYWDNTAQSWQTPSTSGSPTMTGVSKVRFAKLYWAVPKLVLVDGVNPAATWDGTTYTQITDPNAPTDPSLVEDFSSHLFLAGDPSEPYNIYFSAPFTESDFDPANGAGVLNVGFEVKQLKAFRDVLYVFGANQIKRITGTSIADFTVREVTNNLGTTAPDSVIEFNADLIFLGPDGMRPVSATDRIGDIELGTVSKPVQSLFEQYTRDEDLSTVTVIPIRKKSQFRLFFADQEALGLIGAVKGSSQAGNVFEYSQLIGMEVNAADSGYLGDEEFVIHGDGSGLVYRQESGNDFNGTAITSVYRTPFLFMDDPLIRKNFYDITTYLRAEGAVTITLGVSYNYEDTENVLNPTDYSISNEGAAAIYNTGIYDQGFIYDGNPSPVRRSTVSGSGDSMALTYVTTTSQPSHTIQALAVSYGLGDRR